MASLSSGYVLAESVQTLDTLADYYDSIVKPHTINYFPFRTAEQHTFVDYPMVSASKAISGKVYLDDGSEAAGATVKLFREYDDRKVAEAITDSQGVYVFARDEDDPHTYYVLAYIDGSPQVHGVSDRGTVPT